jgi:tripartite-type tricarboxylate transporter receptor subunit TctC
MNHFALGLALLPLTGAAAFAQSVEQFYTGKTINFIVGAGAGGSYDIYARTLANHMGKHILRAMHPRGTPGYRLFGVRCCIESRWSYSFDFFFG